MPSKGPLLPRAGSVPAGGDGNNDEPILSRRGSEVKLCGGAGRESSEEEFDGLLAPHGCGHLWAFGPNPAGMRLLGSGRGPDDAGGPEFEQPAVKIANASITANAQIRMGIVRENRRCVTAG
jgi:hypothetical protein